MLYNVLYNTTPALFLKVTRGCSVSDVKQKLESIWQIPAPQQRLLLRGKHLEGKSDVVLLGLWLQCIAFTDTSFN